MGLRRRLRLLEQLLSSGSFLVEVLQEGGERAARRCSNWDGLSVRIVLPSAAWLGNWSPLEIDQKVRLWLVQHLSHPPMSGRESGLRRALPRRGSWVQ